MGTHVHADGVRKMQQNASKIALIAARAFPKDLESMKMYLSKFEVLAGAIVVEELDQVGT